MGTSSSITPAQEAGWRVLLIGGNSGAGKTGVAQELARRLSISCLPVDDVRIALQQNAAPGEQPDLQVFLRYSADQWRDPEGIRRDWIKVGQSMLRPLRAIIAHHLVVPSAGRIILEGDGILPALGLAETYADVYPITGRSVARELRSLFIIELAEDQLLSNLLARRGGFESWDLPEQRAFARASGLFGQWLADETAAQGLPIVPARPTATVAERVLAYLREWPGEHGLFDYH